MIDMRPFSSNPFYLTVFARKFNSKFRLQLQSVLTFYSLFNMFRLSQFRVCVRLEQYCVEKGFFSFRGGAQFLVENNVAGYSLQSCVPHFRALLCFVLCFEVYFFFNLIIRRFTSQYVLVSITQVVYTACTKFGSSKLC